MKKLFIGLAILFSVTVQAQVSIWRTPTFTGRADSARFHVSEMLNGRVYDRSLRLDSLPGSGGGTYTLDSTSRFGGVTSLWKHYNDSLSLAVQILENWPSRKEQTYSSKL